MVGAPRNGTVPVDRRHGGQTRGMTTTQHRTKIGIAISTRERVAGTLQPVLASLVDLALAAKHAHWNVKGPNFQALHTLFDEVAATAQASADTVAERIVQLGGVAMGRRQDLGGSRLPVYSDQAVNGPEHVEALATALAEAGKAARNLIGEMAELGDDVTADILTEVARDLDKQLWFVDAHAQG